MNVSPIDIFIIIAYFTVVVGISIRVSRGKRTAEKFFVAGRNVPMWAVAFTIMATLISTGTFVGHTGTAYQRGLILFIPHLIAPFVLLGVAHLVVPFYRRVVRMSAYEYIGQRFGVGGRIYTSFSFLIDRIFDLSVTMLTTALAVNVLTGWSMPIVILAVGLFTISYTMIGGQESVVWTDVVQGALLITGGLAILLRLMFAPEAGPPFAVVAETFRAGKLDLGLHGFSWHALFSAENSTTYLFVVAYAVQWARRYSVDQHVVQRYLVAKDDRAATRGAFVSAVICVPTFAMFMFSGACLYGFFSLSGLPLPPVADNAMPYFLSHYMPVGLMGLVLASVLAAATASSSSDLSSVATVLTADYYKRLVPGASDRALVACGRLMIVAGGVATMSVAWLLLPKEGAAPLMERVIVIATILSAGMLGLFCLGFFTRSATRQGCYVGIGVCAVYTIWAISTQPGARLIDLGAFNFPFNPLLIGVFGHLVLFGSGYIASRLFGGYVPEDIDRLTYWGAQKTLRQAKSGAAVANDAKL